MITLTITDARLLAGVDASKAQNAPDQSAEVYMQAWLDQLLDSWAVAYKIGIVSSGDFVLRFTSTEFYDINTAALTDPHIAGFLTRIREIGSVTLYSAGVIGAMQYLVEKALVTQERSAEILTWVAPTPAPEPAPS
jgi:hypothetical protein